MDTVHKQEYRIRDLSTRSVTLFPTRAQVVREIKNVSLKPGANEIIVVGLTPTADQESIKVEGTGSAIITDITVELLPNREIFQDIYPDSDDESEDDKDDDDDDEEDDDDVNHALEGARDKHTELMDKQKAAREIINSAETRLKILDAHGESLDKKDSINVDIGASLGSYRRQRTMIFQDHLEGTLQERALRKEIAIVEKQISRLVRQQAKKDLKAAKAKAKVKRAKDKIRTSETRREAERQKEKLRIRKERENFWPRLCYSVRITLDAASFTPSSSRRSSVASASDVVKVATGKEEEHSTTACDLSLTYVTSSAFWSPSYDLALSTTTNTATLCFDAQLTNMTSETWSNCKVILSTSQTTFSGLQDEIPALVPWRVKLAGRGGGALSTDIIDSREERLEKGNWKAAQTVNQIQKPRAHLFGVPDTDSHDAAARGALAQMQQQMQQAQMQAMMQAQAQNQARMQMQLVQQHSQQQQMQQSVPPPRPPPPPGGGAQAPLVDTLSFYRDLNADVPPAPNALYAKSSKAFGSTSNISNRLEGAGSSRYRGGVKRRSAGGRDSGIDEELGDSFEEELEQESFHDGATILEPTPSLAFQESSFEETGLTATYDLPSLKTLKPSSTASKQRVARISFTHVLFSHTVIAKYKPVAYLKAKLRNTSPLTLLKGTTGLTLDGTFMGRSSLPRCSAGDTFTLSLGIDPAIKVAYPKPEIKRSTTGVFTKGDNSVYTRTITVVNSRAAGGAKFVNITVMDQVPVSEDEKLRIDLSYPRGLSVNGPVVATGIPGKEGSATAAAGAAGEKDWGKAVAVLKKAGEVSWDVQLAAGRSVKLLLQYEVVCPSGERIAQV
ncbi:hypothetical protein QBC37DRAFT_423659 [Rhypophila decipiens]|uniref:Mucoidy inhibitor-like protein n=1 Tax=Rhypophila decipiens TaxID=261697 RepID=A0AAN6Y6E5_9PEZI|nr:hypothetical protein QBC37DRAFT_423659 [Rhypophila decipiens]